MALDETLGNRLSLRIDPTYPHASLWKHPNGNSLKVTYVNLEEGIQETASPNYSDIEITGRAEGYKVFSGTSNKEITLTFRFQATDHATVKEDVIYPARFLDALKYPLTNGNLSYPPPPCLLKIGTLLMARVVVTSADITWEAPFDVETMEPHSASVPVTFTIVRRVSQNLEYDFDGVFQ
jgi:hypothetical protein